MNYKSFLLKRINLFIIFVLLLVGNFFLSNIVLAEGTYVPGDQIGTERIIEDSSGAFVPGNQIGTELICGDFSYKYPECNWNTHQVYDVYQDSCGSYDKRNYQYQVGSCGYNPFPAAPVNTVQTQPQQPEVRSCGNFILKGSECDWNSHQVYEYYQNSCGTYDRRNYHTVAGLCNAPAQVAVQPQVQAERLITTCKGTMPYSQFATELRMAGYNGSWDDGSAVRGYNNAACPAQGAPVAPVRVVAQPTPVPQVQQIVFVPNPTPNPISDLRHQISDVRCPSGTNMIVENSTVICVSVQQQVEQRVQQQNTQTQTVIAQGGNANAQTGPITVNVPAQNQLQQLVYYQPQVYQPQVVSEQTVPVKQLPNTGLPLGASLLGGLAPAGWILKRFARGVNIKEDASAIWQVREYLKA